MTNPLLQTAKTPAAVVLVVDDEPMIRWSIEQTLTAAGYQVLGAATGAEGLALIEKVHPDLVFLDVHLPDANGLSLIERIKSDGARIAVIVMTAYEDERTASDARSRGADHFLGKPFNFDELTGVAGQVLDRVSLG